MKLEMRLSFGALEDRINTARDKSRGGEMCGRVKVEDKNGSVRLLADLY